ncbi:hypothetical protein F5B19DRAFT_3934 [Rostrohypoxylon terebratum]|nr:hypothetical protein F5B19DRAFT_3934 [Rostrohypoxylon terebratum]
MEKQIKKQTFTKNLKGFFLCLACLAYHAAPPVQPCRTSRCEVPVKKASTFDSILIGSSHPPSRLLESATQMKVTPALASRTRTPTLKGLKGHIYTTNYTNYTNCLPTTYQLTVWHGMSDYYALVSMDLCIRGIYNSYLAHTQNTHHYTTTPLHHYNTPIHHHYTLYILYTHTS